ncbi:hypothetical protein [Enterobacter kobei]|uniref:hypothetical protein n=1 Tax=Enterobacter kobei TaxID=208224 RepID=UPI0020054201|nr:hypothetical protein [Enterobacter kobei]MCK6864715.1 hypothetical protein [Enterobacter kobei]
MKPTHEELERYGRQADITIENLEQKLAVSQREFRAADATIENLQMQVEKLAAERDIVNGDNAYLRDLVICWARECDRITFTHTNKITDAHQMEAEQELSNTTTAASSFLAEVRAQGVEMLNTQFKKCTGMLYADSVVSTAEHFAAQLRKGVQS